MFRPQLILACYGMNDGLMQAFDKARFQAYQEGNIRDVYKRQTMVMQMMATPQLPNHPWKRLSSQFIGTLRNTSPTKTNRLPKLLSLDKTVRANKVKSTSFHCPCGKSENPLQELG